MKVTAGIFRKNNSVLLMRRAPTEPLAGEWEYPGGKFEDGEDGPTCLHRELKEELQDLDTVQAETARIRAILEGPELGIAISKVKCNRFYECFEVAVLGGRSICHRLFGE